MRLGKEEIENISIGAAVLGTGGGGDPFIGKLLALDAIENYGEVECLSVNSIDDDDFVVPVAMMGAPTVAIEKIPNGSEGLWALRHLESYVGRKTSAIVPVEQGGINSTIPIAVAAAAHLPVVDCDGMGRAFPEVQMVTFHLEGITAAPMVLADERGNTTLINACSNTWMERIARAVTVQMGGSTLTASYSMEGWQLKRACVPNSVSLSLRLGSTIRNARRKGRNPTSEILSVINGEIIFTGKVVDIVRRTSGGFAKGKVKIHGLGKHDGQSLHIEFQNENLVATIENNIAVSVPDLIIILDYETGVPVTTEAMKYGQRVTVVGAPCDDRWRTSKGLETVGPKCFGYNIEYTPLRSRT